MLVNRLLVLLPLMVLCLAPEVAFPAQRAGAQTEPANNPVGINLVQWTDPRHFRAAAELVNSNGGDWGYVTIMLVDENRLDLPYIQRLLDECQGHRLTPIIRVATRYDPGRRVWLQPAPEDPWRWKWVLDQMRWPTATRYVLVGNEPNLGHEWGGAVDPAGYARYLSRWLDIFAHDARYRIFNGALDASNDTLLPEMQDEFEFIEHMRVEVPDIFERLHGWASSPYHFWWGSEDRYTYRAYEVELEMIGREMPVIITEFHTPHLDNPALVAHYYERAFKHWLNDPRVLAATPMFWNPEQNRFWMYNVDEHGSTLYPSPTYFRIKSFSKAAGSPAFRPSLENSPRPTPTPTPTPLPNHEEPDSELSGQTEALGPVFMPRRTQPAVPAP